LYPEKSEVPYLETDMSYFEEDFETPAMRQVVKTKVSPGAVAEAMEDPVVFEQVARGDLYVELTRLRRLANSNAMPVKSRLEYAQFLSKMGKVDKPEPTDDPLHRMPSISIIFPGAGQSTSATPGATYAPEDSE